MDNNVQKLLGVPVMQVILQEKTQEIQEKIAGQLSADSCQLSGHAALVEHLCVSGVILLPLWQYIK